MISELLRVGDKVEVRFVQQVEQEKVTGVAAKVYKCKLADITEDGELEITMPIENGKMVLLPLGIRFEFTFYTASGMYHSIGQIKERYKKDNIYMVLAELHSQIKKCQRREFYRYPCLIECQYFLISKEDAETKTTDELIKQLRDDYFYDRQNHGTVHDLSGGGVRMIGDIELECESYVLLLVRLTNDKMDKQYSLISQVLDSKVVEGRKDKFESRVQFIFEDGKVREEIIRYIFEEERKSRQIN